MRLAPPFAAIGLLALALPAASEACGRRGCHHGHQRRQAVVACAPAAMTAAAQPTMAYATPQAAYAAPQMGPAAAAAAPVAAAPVDASPQPTYDYAATPGGVPAYYYTYDASGKLIIAQWMDWVFRGGRIAGEPAPPLPIIGALRNR